MATVTTRIVANTVDEYIKTFPPSIHTMLVKIRQTIRETAPDAEEVISYGIAGYRYHGMLIYFAGFTNHVSMYPAPRGAESFKKELAAYKGGKGTIQFLAEKPLPISLIKRIIKFRIKENLEKAKSKKK
jgi:uncharacterized protein YdhG (YjbR/CyaY superfamily)